MVNVIKQVIPNETIVKIVGSITDPAKQVGPAGLPNRYLNFSHMLLSSYFQVTLLKSNVYVIVLTEIDYVIPYCDKKYPIAVFIIYNF